MADTYRCRLSLPSANRGEVKNVKNVAEMWTWVASALPLFGFGKLDVSLFTETTKKALGHTNAKVRQGKIFTLSYSILIFLNLKNNISDIELNL